MTTYRCKVRKPDNTTVDGCGHVVMRPETERYSRDSMPCPSCKVGFLREVVGAQPERLQIHGGPLVVQALNMANYKTATERTPRPLDRADVMRHVRTKLGAILVVEGTYGSDASLTASIAGDTQAAILECVALLRSLLPADADADADKAAQVEMAAEHNASADRKLSRGEQEAVELAMVEGAPKNALPSLDVLHVFGPKGGLAAFYFHPNPLAIDLKEQECREDPFQEGLRLQRVRYVLAAGTVGEV